MNFDTNPWFLKFAVSTGGKQRPRFRFVRGSVSDVVNRLESQGVTVVALNRNPDYVVLPDGQHNPGQTDAATVSYSELQVWLKQFVKPPVSAYTMESKLSTGLATVNSETSPSLSGHAFEQLAKPEWERFLHAVLRSDTEFFPVLYQARQTILIDMKAIVDVALQSLRSWRDLYRIALQLKPVQPRLKDVWTDYRTQWNSAARRQLWALSPEQIDMLDNEGKAALRTFFKRWEGDVYTIAGWVQEAQVRMKERLTTWATEIKAQYQSSKCQPAFCFFDGQRKPMLFVLDDLVLAYCGVPGGDPKIVRYLHDYILRIYQAWFNPDAEIPGAQLCDQLQYMYKAVMATLKQELALHGKLDIMWDELPTVFQMSRADWDLLWSSHSDERARVIKALRAQVHSERYQELLAQLVTQLFGSV